MLMGCFCSKGVESDDRDEARRLKSSRSLKRLVSSSKKDEVLVADANGNSVSDGGRVRLISNSEDIAASPARSLVNGVEKKVEVAVDRVNNGIAHQRRPDVDQTVEKKPGYAVREVPNGFEAEHIAAGWPPWLTAVAGEAVKGWLPRKADSFEKLNKVDSLVAARVGC